ncbi:MAG TPA: SprT-like domain-containing protein [Steroidobacteraceae bacterium]|nr:SprT-like domain-containing protein [Steroidobacteraceae bacterium]
MSIDELKARLEVRVEECHRLVAAVHPHFPKVSCNLFSRRRAAGLAFGNEHRIALNEVLLRENPDAMLRDTVAHEFAHIVVWWRYLEDRKLDPATAPPSAHGAEWQAVMRDLFAVEPKRCHRFDTSNTGARIQRRWEYRCRCQSHLLTTSKHKRAQSGASYVCQDCKTELAAAHVYSPTTPAATGVHDAVFMASPTRD